MEKQTGYSVKIRILFILLILLAVSSFNKMTIPLVLSSGFGCSGQNWCNDESACNTHIGGGQGDFGHEICVYPTQNKHGYYIGNESFYTIYDDISYADSLSSGVSIYYDCNGDCIADSDCDGICDFMDLEDSSNCP